MKRIIAAAAAALVLCGCSQDSVKVEIKEKEYEEAGYKVYMEVPEIEGNSDFIKTFNADYTALADEMLKKFSEEAEKSDIPNDSMEFKQSISLNQNGILSIVGECEAFTGGPHGILSRVVRNIDIKNAREISLSDLFTDEEYVNRINSYIEVLMEEKPADFADLWKTPAVAENQGFYLTGKGIVLFYPPYELSYYSKGFVEIEIPYDELGGFLNPDYAQIIQ